MSEVLKVENVSKAFKNQPILQNISFNIERGECVGLIGASGSGKTTLARLLLLLDYPDTGDVKINGRSLFKAKARERRLLRRHIQVVLQDPSSSFNPKLTVFQSLMEPLNNFPLYSPSFLKDVRHSKKQTAEKLLTMVGLSTDLLQRYPHELSGGQKQRLAIARSISLEPSLLICDEPTASIDVSVQAQILNLLKELKETLGLSILFISHDMICVRFISDYVLVLKDGELLDSFPASEMLEESRHSYTKQLISIS